MSDDRSFYSESLATSLASGNESFYSAADRFEYPPSSHRDTWASVSSMRSEKSASTIRALDNSSQGLANLPDLRHQRQLSLVSQASYYSTHSDRILNQSPIPSPSRSIHTRTNSLSMLAPPVLFLEGDPHSEQHSTIKKPSVNSIETNITLNDSINSFQTSPSSTRSIEYQLEKAALVTPVNQGLESPALASSTPESSPAKTPLFRAQSHITSVGTRPGLTPSSPNYRLSYGNEVLDNSYDSSTHTSQIHPNSPLLPPNINSPDQPFVTPTESHPSEKDVDESRSIPESFRLSSDMSNSNNGSPSILSAIMSSSHLDQQTDSSYLYALHSHSDYNSLMQLDFSRQSSQAQTSSILNQNNIRQNLITPPGPTQAVIPSTGYNPFMDFPLRNALPPSKIVPTELDPSADNSHYATANVTPHLPLVLESRFTPQSSALVERRKSVAKAKRVSMFKTGPEVNSREGKQGMKRNVLFHKLSDSLSSLQSLESRDLFASRANTKHFPTTAGTIPPVSLRKQKMYHTLLKSPDHSRSEEEDNQASQDSDDEIQQNSRSSQSVSEYTDTATGSTRQLHEALDPIPRSANTGTGAMLSAGSATQLPSTLLPGSLPLTTPNLPESSSNTGYPVPPINSTEQNDLEVEQVREQERIENLQFLERVNKAQLSLQNTDKELAATAAVARAIIEEENGPTSWNSSSNPNVHPTSIIPGFVKTHKRQSSTRVTTQDPNKPSYEVTQSNTENSKGLEKFLLCVFVIFPPLWLLLGAGFFDRLLGKSGGVTPRTKFLAFVFAGIFFILAIAGLIVGLAVGLTRHR